MHKAEADGAVGAWHRWVIISVAAYVLVTYTILAVVLEVCALLDLWQPLMPTALDWRVLLITVPAGVLAGEAKYQKDVRLNGPQSTVTKEV